MNDRKARDGVGPITPSVGDSDSIRERGRGLGLERRRGNLEARGSDVRFSPSVRRALMEEAPLPTLAEANWQEENAGVPRDTPIEAPWAPSSCRRAVQEAWWRV